MKNLCLKSAITIFCAIILSGNLFAQNYKSFKKVLKKNQLQFEMPEGFEEVPVIENGDMAYDFAIKLKGEPVEIRYTIVSIPELKEMLESDADKTTIDANTFYKSLFMVNILNVSQEGIQNVPKMNNFPEDAVRDEFGAELGMISTFNMKSEFGGDYTFGMMVLIHRSDVADAYITYLATDPDLLVRITENAFYTLTFKD